MIGRVLIAVVGTGCLAGCTIGGSASSGDLRTLEDVGVCTYAQTLDSFPEPALGDVSAMRHWADGLATLADHLRTDWAPEGHPVPKYLAADVRQLRGDAHRFQTAVHAAGGDRQRLQAAFASLATPEFAHANSDIEIWDRLNCSGS